MSWLLSMARAAVAVVAHRRVERVERSFRRLRLGFRLWLDLRRPAGPTDQESGPPLAAKGLATKGRGARGHARAAGGGRQDRRSYRELYIKRNIQAATTYRSLTESCRSRKRPASARRASPPGEAPATATA